VAGRPPGRNLSDAPGTDLTLRFAGATIVGQTREHNEDAFAIAEDDGLVVVADGIGGFNAGEVASAMAVDTIVGFYERAMRSMVEAQSTDGAFDPAAPDRRALFRGACPWLGVHVHAVHDIQVPADLAAFVPTVIEIPRGSNLKYELDKKTGALRLDRVLYSAVHYPANYGFIPRTHAEDNDPLDILVIMDEAVEPMTIVRARPIGGLSMFDEHGKDDKIISVCIDDPAVAIYEAIDALPGHVLTQLQRFFADYKVLEGKKVEIADFYDKAHALDVIRRARAAYDSGKGR
jgi:inorganic pyrophosphatase